MLVFKVISTPNSTFLVLRTFTWRSGRNLPFWTRPFKTIKNNQPFAWRLSKQTLPDIANVQSSTVLTSVLLLPSQRRLKSCFKGWISEHMLLPCQTALIFKEYYQVKSQRGENLRVQINNMRDCHAQISNNIERLLASYWDNNKLVWIVLDFDFLYLSFQIYTLQCRLEQNFIAVGLASYRIKKTAASIYINKSVNIDTI